MTEAGIPKAQFATMGRQEERPSAQRVGCQHRAVPSDFPVEPAKGRSHGQNPSKRCDHRTRKSRKEFISRRYPPLPYRHAPKQWWPPICKVSLDCASNQAEKGRTQTTRTPIQCELSWRSHAMSSSAAEAASRVFCVGPWQRRNLWDHFGIPPVAPPAHTS